MNKNQLQTNDLFEVRDMRVKEKFQIDDAYLNGYARKCGIYATGVYVSLCRHVNKSQECWPSIKKISEELNISERQVIRAIRILEFYKIIFKKRIGKKVNNRYCLLNKSEWLDSESDMTDSHFTSDSQSLHQVTDSHFHSKDTHIKDTHSKGKLTPSEEMKLFLEEDKIYFLKVADFISEKYKAPKEMVVEELTKFKSYWSEKNKSGTKQRWELQKTFELGRRIGTWLRNASQFNKQKSKGKNILI